MFHKYQHLERFGTEEVEGIEDGRCYVFPKIDGTNGSIWCEEGEIKFGSRNRELIEGEKDNAGFMTANKNLDCYKKFFVDHPDVILYGEWLVPHSLKTYSPDTWRKFYVFDVVYYNSLYNGYKYIQYGKYEPILSEYGIKCIPLIAIVENGTSEQFYALLDKNNYLIEDGKGAGEGIVIKRYDYVNKYGRITWAKIVTSEFKEKHIKEMGAPTIKGATRIESRIVDKYLTSALIDKVFNKISNECGGWSSKYIPRLLQTVYYDIVKEECWNFVKEYKNPIIDFNRLNHLCIAKIKELRPELFTAR